MKIVFVEGSPRTMQTLIAGEAQIVESTVRRCSTPARPGLPWSSSPVIST